MTDPENPSAGHEPIDGGDSAQENNSSENEVYEAEFVLDDEPDAYDTAEAKHRAGGPNNSTERLEELLAESIRRADEERAATQRQLAEERRQAELLQQARDATEAALKSQLDAEQRARAAEQRASEAEKQALKAQAQNSQQQAAAQQGGADGGNQGGGGQRGGRGGGGQRNQNQQNGDPDTPDIRHITTLPNPNPEHDKHPQTPEEIEVAEGVKRIAARLLMNSSNRPSVHSIRGGMRLRSPNATGSPEMTELQEGSEPVKNELAWATIKELINWQVITSGSEEEDTKILASNYADEIDGVPIYRKYGGSDSPYSGTTGMMAAEHFFVRNPASQADAKAVLGTRLQAIQNTRPSDKLMHAFNAHFDEDEEGNSRTIYDALMDNGGFPDPSDATAKSIQPWEPKSPEKPRVSLVDKPMSPEDILGRQFTAVIRRFDPAPFGGMNDHFNQHNWFTDKRLGEISREVLAKEVAPDKHQRGNYAHNLQLYWGENYGVNLDQNLEKFKDAEDPYHALSKEYSGYSELLSDSHYVTGRNALVKEAFALTLREVSRRHRHELDGMNRSVRSHYGDTDAALNLEELGDGPGGDWDELLDLRDSWKQSLNPKFDPKEKPEANERFAPTYELVLQARDAAQKVFRDENYHLHYGNRESIDFIRRNQAMYYSDLFTHLADEGRDDAHATSFLERDENGYLNGGIRVHLFENPDNPQEITRDRVVFPDGSQDYYRPATYDRLQSFQPDGTELVWPRH